MRVSRMDPRPVEIAPGRLGHHAENSWPTSIPGAEGAVAVVLQRSSYLAARAVPALVPGATWPLSGRWHPRPRPEAPTRSARMQRRPGGTGGGVVAIRALSPGRRSTGGTTDFRSQHPESSTPFEDVCRTAKCCLRVVRRRWRPKKRMPSSDTSGSVGRWWVTAGPTRQPTCNKLRRTSCPTSPERRVLYHRLLPLSCPLLH
jgi:hypothetical protein